MNECVSRRRIQTRVPNRRSHTHIQIPWTKNNTNKKKTFTKNCFSIKMKTILFIFSNLFSQFSFSHSIHSCFRFWLQFFFVLYVCMLYVILSPADPFSRDSYYGIGFHYYCRISFWYFSIFEIGYRNCIYIYALRFSISLGPVGFQIDIVSEQWVLISFHFGWYCQRTVEIESIKPIYSWLPYDQYENSFKGIVSCRAD